MSEMNKLPARKPMRLKGYDYSNDGAYFLTLCTQNRKNYFGKIARADLLSEPYICYSKYGEIVAEQIAEINQTYTHMEITNYAIMPNHLHMIVFVESGASGTPPPTNGVKNGAPTPTNAAIPALVSTLKRLTNQKTGVKLWQRGYYDHILRDEDDYLKARKYIYENPFGKE